MYTIYQKKSDGAEKQPFARYGEKKRPYEKNLARLIVH